MSAHAGMHPEQGVSATVIAAHALHEVAVQGYFGRVVKGKQKGTSNVGRIRGGEASNQVTDRVLVMGESRSHDPTFASVITNAYRKAFHAAAQRVKNDRGKIGSVYFEAEKAYPPFKMDAKSDIVRFARRVGQNLGLRPRLITVDGGLDANFMNQKGVPTVTIGAGLHGAHTLSEYVDIPEYLDGCRYALALATEV